MTVTFDSQGCTEVASLTVQYGGYATKPSSPSKKGYSFAGWYLNGDPFFFSGPITADVTITAQWSLNTYQISYDVNGGEGAEGNPSTYTVEDADITLAEPTRANYTFLGWYEGNTKFTEIDTSLARDLSLVAKWSAPTAYSITYVLNGGTNNPSNPSTYTSDDVVTLSDPSKEGYDFLGWYTSADFSGGSLYGDLA